MGTGDRLNNTRCCGKTSRRSGEKWWTQNSEGNQLLLKRLLKGGTFMRLALMCVAASLISQYAAIAEKL